MISSAAFRFEVPKRACRRWCRNFKSVTLVIRCPLRRLGELLDNARALKPGDVVDEQHAVEVVDLVLDAAGQEPGGLELLLLAGEVEILHPHLCRSLDILVEFRDREAAFLVRDL